MTNAKRVLALLSAVLIVVGLTSCSGGSSAVSAGPQGNVFVLGTDAPITLPSVVDFNVMVTGVTLSDGTTTTNLLSGGAQTVDFSRLVGLRTLLDLNSVPAGTYTKADVTLSSPMVTFLDTSVSPPKISTTSATLMQSSVTITLPQPLTVNQNGLVGLLIDFHLAKSLQISGGTVTVNPMLTVKAIASNAPDANIDDLIGSVVSTSGSTFVIQTPRGRQITVVTNSQTDFEDNASVASLATNTIVEVSGSLDPATLNLTASEVEVVSTDGFYLEGLLTSVRQSPPNTQIDVLVRREVPALSSGSSLAEGQIITLNLNGSEKYRVRLFGFSIGTRLFDQNNLVAGQQIAVGGVVNSNQTSLTVHRVVLEPQGQIGTWVPGSTNIVGGNTGNFKLTDDSLAGVLFNGPIEVFTFDLLTDFEGISGLSALTGQTSIPLRVRGLILLDQATSSPVILGFQVATPDSD
jgi:hypothetical protein